MAKNEKRLIVHLKCTDCSEKNYSTTKNKVNTSDKLNLKKYCSTCKKHTIHKEVK